MINKTLCVVPALLSWMFVCNISFDVLHNIHLVLQVRCLCSCTLVISPFLTEAHAKAKNQARKASNFCKNHKDAMTLLYSWEDIKAVNENEGQWSTVAEQLKRLNGKHSIGLRLWSTGSEEIMNEEVQKIVLQHAKKLMEDQVCINEDKIQQVRRDCLQDIYKLPWFENLGMIRSTSLCYRGTDFKHKAMYHDMIFDI